MAHVETKNPGENYIGPVPAFESAFWYLSWYLRVVASGQLTLCPGVLIAAVTIGG